MIRLRRVKRALQVHAQALPASAFRRSASVAGGTAHSGGLSEMLGTFFEIWQEEFAE